MKKKLITITLISLSLFMTACGSNNEAKNTPTNTKSKTSQTQQSNNNTAKNTITTSGQEKADGNVNNATTTSNQVKTNNNSTAKNSNQSSKITTSNTSNATNTALKAYKDVLQNKAEFYNTDAKKNMHFNNFLSKNEVFDCVFKTYNFSIVDMDGDKIPEVIIELSSNNVNYAQFYEVLHYTDNKVYGYIFSNRQLAGVKVDGTFGYSSGARDNGFGKLKFKGDTKATESIGYKKSVGMENELYFIDNKQVTPDKYRSFQNEQSAKQEPAWYLLSQNNVDKELSSNK